MARFKPFCLALALAPALLAQASPEGFRTRLARAERTLDRFYRGETLEAAHNRVNDLVERYNAQLDRRNALVEAYNASLDSGKRVPEVSKERIDALDALIAQARIQVDAERKALDARKEAYEAFRERDGDVAFFTWLNRLLADVRAALRARPDPELREALDKVRALRRELAAWAAAVQASQDHALVLVDVLVGDEPCCFILDTGAQRVCLPGELVDALGLADRLGEASTLTLVGGQKIQGRTIVLPRVAVAGLAVADVAGSAVPASEVGIDGLLGQSFLKHFVYTIDEDRPGKLTLTPRKP